MRLTKLNKLSGEIERLGLPQQLYQKLYKYEEAEEQGQLVRLPCKVGDEFWIIADYWSSLFNSNKHICKFRVRAVGFCGNDIQIKGVYFVNDVSYNFIPMTITVGKNTMKKIFFKTEAEALQALKERE